jgi:hypothetical protein
LEQAQIGSAQAAQISALQVSRPIGLAHSGQGQLPMTLDQFAQPVLPGT